MMTEGEVHEALAMIARRFPEFPYDEQAPMWVQGLALAEPDTVFDAVRTWCERRVTWPFVGEIIEMVARMTTAMARGREAMWAGYVDECRRCGREPTAEYLRPEPVA